MPAPPPNDAAPAADGAVRMKRNNLPGDNDVAPGLVLAREAALDSAELSSEVF
jgi:hypothetical protein